MCAYALDDTSYGLYLGGCMLETWCHYKMVSVLRNFVFPCQIELDVYLVEMANEYYIP